MNAPSQGMWVLPESVPRQTACGRIADALRERIERGELAPGAALPSEAQLREEFGVARGTVRSALLELRDAGLVVSVPSRRWVVRVEGASKALTASAEAGSAVEVLRNELTSGAYEPGKQFPSVSALMERFGVTRYIAYRALSDLAASGLLVSVQSRGYFVPEEKPDAAPEA